jgi:hypothetical protein
MILMEPASQAGAFSRQWGRDRFSCLIDLGVQAACLNVQSPRI